MTHVDRSLLKCFKVTSVSSLEVRTQELCEEEGGLGLALIPYPVLPLSLLNRTVSVDVKQHERKKPCASELRSEEGGGPGLSFPIPFFTRP